MIELFIKQHTKWNQPLIYLSTASSCIMVVVSDWKLLFLLALLCQFAGLYMWSCRWWKYTLTDWLTDWLTDSVSMMWRAAQFTVIGCESTHVCLHLEVCCWRVDMNSIYFSDSPEYITDMISLQQLLTCVSLHVFTVGRSPLLHSDNHFAAGGSAGLDFLVMLWCAGRIHSLALSFQSFAVLVLSATLLIFSTCSCILWNNWS